MSPDIRYKETVYTEDQEVYNDPMDTNLPTDAEVLDLHRAYVAAAKAAAVWGPKAQRERRNALATALEHQLLELEDQGVNLFRLGLTDSVGNIHDFEVIR